MEPKESIADAHDDHGDHDRALAGGYPRAGVGVRRRNPAEDQAATAALEALVDPPSACPGCVALTGQPWPEGATSAYCPQCIAQAQRVWQCKRWNADPAHQSLAGQASFTAFSARWRAEQGAVPLTSEAVRRYVTPEHIRGPLGMPLPESVSAAVYRAWCDGLLISVVAWLSDDPPPDPDGLWAASTPITPSIPTA